MNFQPFATPDPITEYTLTPIIEENKVGEVTPIAIQEYGDETALAAVQREINESGGSKTVKEICNNVAARFSMSAETLRRQHYRKNDSSIKKRKTPENSTEKKNSSSAKLPAKKSQKTSKPKSRKQRITRLTVPNAKTGFRILTSTDAENCFSMEEAIDCQYEAFLTESSMETPERIRIETNKGPTLIKPAINRNTNGLGMKVVSVRPENSTLNLPTVGGFVLLTNNDTGYLKCLLDAAFLTAQRTAGGSAVATRNMIRNQQNCSVLTVFGSGQQAKLHIEAMITIKPCINTLYIVNRTKAHAEQLASEMATKYQSKDLKVFILDKDENKIIQIFQKNEINDNLNNSNNNINNNNENDNFNQNILNEDSLNIILSQTDILCTCTNSFTPLFDGSKLKENCHINAVGSFTPDMQEIDEFTILNSSVIIDTTHACESGDFKPVHDNLELIENIVCGTLNSRLLNLSHLNDSKRFTLFKSVGVAFQDIAAAEKIFDKSVQSNIGTISGL